MQKQPKKAKPASGKRAPQAKRGEGRVRKLARVVDAALKDADAARKHAFDPEFKKELGKDRRSTLSRFRTVQHALADRERIEKEKGSKPS
jgi:hypothetical protein